MKNLRISLKLMLSFTIVLIFIISVGLVGISGMGKIKDADSKMYEHNLLAIAAMLDIQTNFKEQRLFLRDIVLYDPDTSTFKDSLDGLNALDKKIQDDFAKYESTIDTGESKELFNEIKSMYYNEYSAIKPPIIAAGSANNLEHGLIELGKGTIPANRIQNLINNSIEINKQLSAESQRYNDELTNKMTSITVIVIICAVILSMLLAFYLTNLIGKPVKFLSELLKKISSTGNIRISEADKKVEAELKEQKDEVGDIAFSIDDLISMLNEKASVLEIISDGDLTSEITVLSENDVIGNALLKVSDNLNNMFGEIATVSRQVAIASKDIAEGSQHLAVGSTQQAAVVEQLSASMDEIAMKTKHNAEKADSAASLGKLIKQNAENGNELMERMIKAVEEVNDASKSIHNVIKVINNIAFQTKILALNAALEAARSGQHGKGFAVVAEEVGNLAAKSAEAAMNTGVLIANSIKKAELGAQIAGETAVSLAQIVGGINDSSDLVNYIANSSNEQSVAIRQINEGIEQVTEVIQQNSSTAEESAAASEEMSSQSGVLQSLIEQFKIKGNKESWS